MNFKYNKHYRRFLGVANKHFPVVMAKARFKKMFGRKLDLDNPKDLNEKILWLSLFSDTTEWTRLADKYAVREFVRERGCDDLLVQLYGKWGSVDEIDWQNLPDSFVMKTNNGCGTVLLVNEKKSLKHPEIDKRLDYWLHKSMAVATTEFHYWKIKPCLIAEQLLTLSENDKKYSSSIVDYKIWCFNGKPHYIWTVSNRDKNGFDGALFDINWNHIPNVVRNNHPRIKQPSVLLPKPEKLDLMLQAAEKLSKGFPEVRVDLYHVDGKVYFGELTFTCHGGTIDYFVPEILLEMGQKIDLSGVKKVRNT